MIGFLIKLAVLLVVAVLGYNYFFGTEAEQAQSAKVFSQMKEVAVSVAELAKSEKDKFDAGKYDAALDKLGDAYQKAREGAKYLDANLLKRFNELEQRKDTLEKEVQSIDKEEKASAGDKDEKKAAERQKRKEKLNKEMEKLLDDSNALLKEAQGKK